MIEELSEDKKSSPAPPRSQQSPSEVGDYELDECYSIYRQFVKDLEFVQMLADIDYVRQLHVRGYLYDPQFREYISALSYLLAPENIRLIRCPEGLWTLKAFQREGFIESIKDHANFERFQSHCVARNQRICETYR
jgi:hypothetical protein